MLRAGDTLKITRLDRLGRSVLHLVTLGAELRERGVGLHVIEQGIDTTTAEGRAMFGMLSVLAELQRELIIANTHDGLAAARRRGRNGGRPPKLNPRQTALAQQLYDAGERTVQQIADLFSVPRTTVYGHLDPATKGKRPPGPRTPTSPSHLAPDPAPLFLAGRIGAASAPAALPPGHAGAWPPSPSPLGLAQSDHAAVAEDGARVRTTAWSPKRSGRFAGGASESGRAGRTGPRSEDFG